MKLPLLCMECRLPSDNTPQDLTLYSVPVADDNIYRFTCRNGHKVVIYVQEEKFEILFEIALNALVDGYNMEAVSSATSSLERFHEFFVRFICCVHEVSHQVFEQAWKHSKNMSERQLGMFIAAYLFHFKEAPNLLPNAQISLRNEVIHKGLIPEREKSIEYLNAVFNHITPIMQKLKSTGAEQLSSFVSNRYFERRRKNESSAAAMTIATAISLIREYDSDALESIEPALKRIMSGRARGW